MLLYCVYIICSLYYYVRFFIINNRLGSLTSVSCKVMEAIVKDKKLQLLETTKIVSKYLNGFVRTCACLLQSFEAWTESLDEGYGVKVIYLDF